DPRPTPGPAQRHAFDCLRESRSLSTFPHHSARGWRRSRRSRYPDRGSALRVTVRRTWTIRARAQPWRSRIRLRRIEFSEQLANLGVRQFTHETVEVVDYDRLWECGVGCRRGLAVYHL